MKSVNKKKTALHYIIWKCGQILEENIHLLICRRIGRLN